MINLDGTMKKMSEFALSQEILIEYFVINFHNLCFFILIPQHLSDSKRRRFVPSPFAISVFFLKPCIVLSSEGLVHTQFQDDLGPI